MKATVYSHATIIGTADLLVGDKSIGCVYGHFIPNDNYFRDIQKFVWEFCEAKRPDYTKWHSLRFNVRLENGYFLFPCGGYTIDDIHELPSEPKRIDIAGIDLDILRLKAEDVLPPWSAIGIAEKISFEDELKREITYKGSLFDIFTVSKRLSHVLIGAEVSAFAKFEPSDDVLFQVVKNGELNCLAVVHLTWVRGQERRPDIFPETHFYRDFDDFNQRRMKQDNANWS